MASHDPEVLWPKLESDGIESVQKKLSQGVYSQRKIPVIKEWLRRKQEEQSAPTHMYHPDLAPTGKVYPASEIPKLREAGWVDSPAKFSEIDTDERSLEPTMPKVIEHAIWFWKYGWEYKWFILAVALFSSAIFVINRGNVPFLNFAAPILPEMRKSCQFVAKKHYIKLARGSGIFRIEYDPIYVHPLFKTPGYDTRLGLSSEEFNNDEPNFRICSEFSDSYENQCQDPEVTNDTYVVRGGSKIIELEAGIGLRGAVVAEPHKTPTDPLIDLLDLKGNISVTRIFSRDPRSKILLNCKAVQ